MRDREEGRDNGLRIQNREQLERLHDHISQRVQQRDGDYDRTRYLSRFLLDAPDYENRRNNENNNDNGNDSNGNDNNSDNDIDNSDFLVLVDENGNGNTQSSSQQTDDPDEVDGCPIR
jgi:hypothetical protein